jgi:hypothetical protein
VILTFARPNTGAQVGSGVLVFGFASEGAAPTPPPAETGFSHDPNILVSNQLYTRFGFKPVGHVESTVTPPPDTTGQTILMPGGLTRKKYRELLALERAAKEAERKALRLEKIRARDAYVKRQAKEEALRAAEEARAAVLEAKRLQELDAEQQHYVAALHNALNEFNTKRATSANEFDIARHLFEAARAAKAKFEQDDEEEAMALLMLH